MPYEKFVAETAAFAVHAMWSGGRICGALMVQEAEVHACILPWAFGRWFGRRAARVLNAIIDDFGEATTHATTEKGRLFVEALGFRNVDGIYRSNKKWVLNRSSAP